MRRFQCQTSAFAKPEANFFSFFTTLSQREPSLVLHGNLQSGGVAHLRLQNWRVRSTKAFITGSVARSALQARAISHAASGIESSLKRTPGALRSAADRKSTRLNSSHVASSYA